MLVSNRPSLEQFHIQLWQKVSQLLTEEIEIPSHPVSDTPSLLDEDSWKIRFPKNYRTLVSLVVCHWEFPEELHWRVHLDLEDMSFSWLNDSQRITLKVLLNSKETCERFLYESRSFSKEKIFGNVLGNDFKELFKIFKVVRRKQRPPTPSVWRRGYRDKGCRIPDHQWREKFDFSFTAEQVQLEHRQILISKTITHIIEYLQTL